LKSDNDPLSNDCTVTWSVEALLLSVEPAGVYETFAVWPTFSFVPGAVVAPEVEAEVVVLAALVLETAVLDVAGAAAPVAPELVDELLPPQATAAATATAVSAAQIDVPRCVPNIITP
jgi:hypothetical protein